MKYIRIKGDTNDADYTETFNAISDEDLAAIQPMIDAIKAFVPYEASIKRDSSVKWTHNHNYVNSEWCRDDLGEKDASEYYIPIVGEECFEHFADIAPYNIHTIKSIHVYEVTEEKQLYKHSYAR